MENNIDPTFNVRELIEASIRRLDDIHNLDIERLDQKIGGKDVQYQIQFESSKEAAAQRFEAQQLALKDALISQEKAVAAALEGTKEAIIKNDANTDKRFDLLSEKIDGVIETTSKGLGERGIYVTHADLSGEMEKLRLSFEGMLRPVVTFMNSNQGTGKGRQDMYGWIAGGVMFLIAISSFIIPKLQ